MLSGIRLKPDELAPEEDEFDDCSPPAVPKAGERKRKSSKERFQPAATKSLKVALRECVICASEGEPAPPSPAKPRVACFAPTELSVCSEFAAPEYESGSKSSAMLAIKSAQTPAHVKVAARTQIAAGLEIGAYIRLGPSAQTCSYYEAASPPVQPLSDDFERFARFRRDLAFRVRAALIVGMYSRSMQAAPSVT